MDRITFDNNSPKAFILAANTLPDTDGGQDQVWSLVFNHADSHPFHLYTTYGLKTRQVQFFPLLLRDNQSLLVDKNFLKRPVVTHYAPSTLKISFQLTSNLWVEFSALLPEPSALMGKITFKNCGETSLEFKLALVFQLLPLGKGQRSHPGKFGAHHIISAQAGGLTQVLFMSGGPTGGIAPLPALSLPVHLKPGESRGPSWALTARHTLEESFETARRLIARPWEQLQQTRLMDHARQTLQLKTGHPDWDATFYLAQTIPQTHFIHHNSEDPTPAVVRTRLPDQPPITIKTIEDQDDLTTLELSHLAQALLPQQPDLMASLVMKTLNRLREDGELLSKRNISPFIQPYREPPMLAGLCLEIFEITHDDAFLKSVFPLLCKATHPWLFTDSEARIPKPFTWQNLDQCQLHLGLYPFDIWKETGRGLSLEFTESPAVLAMLLREVRSLKKIAERLEDLVSLQRYGKLERTLQEELIGFWNEKEKAFQYRDVQSKGMPEGELLINDHFDKTYTLNRQFKAPQRLICHLTASDERTRLCQVTFSGLDESGQEVVEVFKPSDIRWVIGRSHLTTKSLFLKIKSLNIEGLGSKDQVRLETTGIVHHDITCLAPLWSGGLAGNQLVTLINHLKDGQAPEFSIGIPEVLPRLSDPPKGLENAVSVLWNTLIIQGLARQGRTKFAMEIFSQLMAGIIKGLRDYGGFYSFFRVEDGQPLGKPNVIAGIAPLRLFLEITGIRILSPTRLALWGENPFPWPVEVNWQGLSIYRNKDLTNITFPNGSTNTYESAEPVLITQEQGLT